MTTIAIEINPGEDGRCGECGNWRSDVPMLRNHCTKRGFYVERNEPFCGAFVPKEEVR